MSDQWVVAYTAAGHLQAEIIASLLQSANIQTRLSQESAGAVYALTVGPLGEVEVLVPHEQFIEAKELVEAYQRGELETRDSSEGTTDSQELEDE